MHDFLERKATHNGNNVIPFITVESKLESQVINFYIFLLDCIILRNRNKSFPIKDIPVLVESVGCGSGETPV